MNRAWQRAHATSLNLKSKQALAIIVFMSSYSSSAMSMKPPINTWIQRDAMIPAWIMNLDQWSSLASQSTKYNPNPAVIDKGRYIAQATLRMKLKMSIFLSFRNKFQQQAIFLVIQRHPETHVISIKMDGIARKTRAPPFWNMFFNHQALGSFSAISFFGRAFISIVSYTSVNSSYTNGGSSGFGKVLKQRISCKTKKRGKIFLITCPNKTCIKMRRIMFPITAATIAVFNCFIVSYSFSVSYQIGKSNSSLNPSTGASFVSEISQSVVFYVTMTILSVLVLAEISNGFEKLILISSFQAPSILSDHVNPSSLSSSNLLSLGL